MVEDAPSSPLSPELGDIGVANGESEDEMDWEEVAVLAPVIIVPSEVTGPPNDAGPSMQNGLDIEKPVNIEITLKRAKTDKGVDPKRKKQAELNAELRALRLVCHKIHTIALLSNALTRNKWINDPLLHARLLSLTPIALQTPFSMITKKRHPDPAKRGRLFETAMMRLTQWWYESFEVLPHGHIKSRSFNQVQKILFNIEADEDEGEVIRSSKSLMKRALLMQGSRDVSAQLFTALCRALDIPARLIVSLQSVPWQANVGKPKAPGNSKSTKGKEKANEDVSEDENEENRRVADDEGSEDDDMEEVSIPGTPKGQGNIVFPGDGQTLSGKSTPSHKGKEKALPKPVIRLRRSKPTGRRLGSRSTSRQSTPPPPVGGFPPVFWTEVFSRPDGVWIPVDPVRYIVNKRRVFEPPSHDKDNRMVYVVAVEEDGYCRDVTPRYAKEFGSKTTKAQLGGKGRKEWWEGIMSLVTRPYRLHRDDVEDEEFESNQYREGMPTSVAGFKDHPLYALEQHLKREEVIFPKNELGKFRGEPVYPRSNVIPLKTAENWMRAGRRVKEGAQAMKWVKQRAVTIHRRRAMELAQQEGDEMMQGLYSEEQTELYVPDPIIDGVVPKNDFGNIDLYTPSMLPAGAAHIPYKGVAKVARKLGFDHAEAVTSFEFKKGRAFPVLSGIVVAAENEQAILEAYWEAERDAEEKERAKRTERVIKRWTRLIQGLRLRQRLQEQYGGKDIQSTSGQPVVEDEPHEQDMPGGFLTEADTVVQPFHLPRFEHVIYQPTSNDVGTAAEQDELADKAILREETPQSSPLPSTSAVAKQLEYDDDDDDLEEIGPSGERAVENTNGVTTPKTMRELAEAAAVKKTDDASSDIDAYSANLATSAQPATLRPTRVMGLQEQSVAKSLTSNPARTWSVRKRSITPSDESDNVASILESGSSDEDDSDSAMPTRKRKSSARRGKTTTSTNLKRKRRESATLTPQVPTTTRTLRPRFPKSAEKLKAEEEAELAFREAIGK